MLKNPVIELNIEQTLGDLFFIGSEAVYEYVDKKKTDKVIGFNYNLASTVQGDSVRVKVLGTDTIKDFKMMQKVELVGLEVKPYITKNGNFANLDWSLKALDIKNA